MNLNKKYSTLSIIAVVVVGVIALFYSGVFNESKISSRELGKALPQVECNFGNDQKAYLGAIESSDINTCDCITNVDLKNDCKNITFDLNLYKQAINQQNPEICDGIKEGSRKQACQTMTEGSVEYLSEEDPQYLAGVYSKAHDKKAIEVYEKLLQDDPENIENLLALSLAYAEKGLKEQEQGRDQTPFVEKALVTIEKAKQLEPNNSEVYRVEAYAYEIQPDIFKAIEFYDKAIELDANNILAYAGRGHANSMIGILEGALGDFKKAAELDVNNEEIFIYSNLCRLESSRTDLYIDAISNCKIVISLEGTDSVFSSNAHQILSTIYIKSNDYSQAESHLLKAKSLTPKDPNLFVTLSHLYLAKEDFVKAEEVSREAISLSPTKASPYRSLSYSLYQQEKFDEAIKVAKKGLSLVKDDVSLLEPNKPALNRDLYYTLANIYNITSDTENEMKYKELGDNALLVN